MSGVVFKSSRLHLSIIPVTITFENLFLNRDKKLKICAKSLDVALVLKELSSNTSSEIISLRYLKSFVKTKN